MYHRVTIVQDYSAQLMKCLEEHKGKSGIDCGSMCRAYIFAEEACINAGEVSSVCYTYHTLREQEANERKFKLAVCLLNTSVRILQNIPNMPNSLQRIVDAMDLDQL